MATPEPISTPAPTMLQSSSGEYGFFETFPKELRDKVYDLLHREVDVNHGGYHYFRITVPIVAVRLISRQFKVEYDEQCSKSDYTKQLRVLDHRNLGDDMVSMKENRDFDKEPLLPLLATRSTSLTAIFAGCSCTYIPEPLPTCGGHNVVGFTYLVAQIAESLPHLSRECLHERLYLTIEKDGCVQGILKVLQHKLRNDGRQVHAPHLENLKIILLYPGCKSIEDGENRALATWTLQDGLVKDEEAVNGCLERAAAKGE